MGSNTCNKCTQSHSTTNVRKSQENCMGAEGGGWRLGVQPEAAPPVRGAQGPPSITGATAPRKEGLKGLEGRQPKCRPSSRQERSFGAPGAAAAPNPGSAAGRAIREHQRQGSQKGTHRRGNNVRVRSFRRRKLKGTSAVAGDRSGGGAGGPRRRGGPPARRSSKQLGGWQ